MVAGDQHRPSQPPPRRCLRTRQTREGVARCRCPGAEDAVLDPSSGHGGALPGRARSRRRVSGSTTPLASRKSLLGWKRPRRKRMKMGTGPGGSCPAGRWPGAASRTQPEMRKNAETSVTLGQTVAPSARLSTVSRVYGLQPSVFGTSRMARRPASVMSGHERELDALWSKGVRSR